MATDNPEDRKHKLEDAIDRVFRASVKVLKLGQDIVEEANIQRQNAESEKRIINILPDDSYMKTEEWERKTNQWNDGAARFEEFIINTNYNASAFITASTATGTSGYALPNAFIRELPDDKRSQINKEVARFTDVIEASSWDKMIEDDFGRLGIDKDEYDQKSALNLLQSAHNALKRPSNGTADEIAVLVPAREAINRCLADMLRKRPIQEPAKRTKDKVKSICNQLSFSHITKRDIDQLAVDAEELIDQLSESKNHKFTSSEISALFNKTRAFMKALLLSIDDKKM